MADEEVNLESETIERKITMALEAPPLLEISAGFAARVAAKLPARPTAVITPARYGVGATIVCLVALMALMLVFSPKAAQGSAYWLSIQSVFCAQFVLLAVWLVARRYRSTGRP